MLCAVCISMFQNVHKNVEGPHHETVNDLIAAAQSGCRICIFENLRREKFGTEQDNAIFERPILRYRFEVGGYEKHKHYWHITLETKASWNQREMTTSIDDFFDGVRVLVHPGEAVIVPSDYQTLLKAAKSDLGKKPWQKKRPWRVRRYGSQRQISSNTGDISTMKVAQNWIRECLENHKSCGNAYRDTTESWYPKRLIAVGEDNINIRLVVTADEQIKGVYAALSHCWGKNPTFVTLTSDNLEMFRENISSSVLPQSFLDMVIACRSLNIGYIWIDSLCILQSGEGSEADWLFHATEMGVIYSNCFLNLSIVHSPSQESGAFRHRNPDSLQDCHVWAPLFYPTPQSCLDHKDWFYEKTMNPTTMRMPERDKLRFCTIFASGADFCGAGSLEPLNTRGWVLQERLLSPCVLQFQQDRIAWECGEVARTEYFPYGSPCGGVFNPFYLPTFNLPLGLRDHSLPPTEPEFEERFEMGRAKGLHPWSLYYWRLVEEYSARDLSFPAKDKLVAFSAVAQQFGPVFGNDYFVGIFKQDMPRGLLWTVSDGTRQCQWRAPSWSWASVDGCVREPLFSRMSGDDEEILVTLEGIHVELADPNNCYGQVISGRLGLKGIVIPWRKNQDNVQHHERNIERGLDSVVGSAREEAEDEGQVCGSSSTAGQPRAESRIRALDPSSGLSSRPQPYFSDYEIRPARHHIFGYHQGFDTGLNIRCDECRDKTIPMLDECFLLPVFETPNLSERIKERWEEAGVEPPTADGVSCGLVLLRQDDGSYTRLGAYNCNEKRLGYHAIAADGAKQQIISIV